MTHRTLLDVFAAQVQAQRGRVALRHEIGGTWRAITWEAWDRRAREIAAGLCALGVEPGDRVALVASTRVSWVEADLGILMAGAVTVPVYPSVHAEMVGDVVRDSGARVVVAESPTEVDKLYAADLDLDHVVVMDESVRLHEPDEQGRVRVHLDDVVEEEDRDRMLSWRQLLEAGEQRLERRPGELADRAQAVEPGSVVSLVYTSGTSGHPKGVTLTHRCFCAEVDALSKVVDLGPGDEQVLFLPLAHVLARITIFLQMRLGYATSFARHPGRTIDACQQRRPTFLVGVPRFFERFHEGVRRELEAGRGLEQRVWRRALDTGQRVAELRRRGREPKRLLAIEHRYAERIVLRSIRARLGGRLRLALSGAAPLDRDTAEFFHAVGLSLLEGYGLTETTGAATLNLPSHYRLGSVGLPLPGVQIRIADDGEVLVRGDTLMRGYHGDTEATAEALDPDGWLRTGDIGRIDADGFLFITDRKKDVLVTSGGEQIAPHRIETELEKSDYVAHAVVVADRRDHAVALVDLARKPLEAWGRNNGLSGDIESLSQHPRVRALVDGVVQDVNRALASYEVIRSFAILPRPLTQQSGELTPTLEVRRRIVQDHYAELIDSLYDPQSTRGPGRSS